MWSILWMLFAAWFLDLFGFGNIVIKGLEQVGVNGVGIELYYLAFAVVGLIKHIYSETHTKENWTISISPNGKEVDKNEDKGSTQSK